MWELLYEEFWDKLEHFCYKLCRDDGRAEDLTQEVFLRALQNQALMESFAPGQCKAWLFATARNLYCDQVRRAVKEESLLALLDPRRCRNAGRDGGGRAGDRGPGFPAGNTRPAGQDAVYPAVRRGIQRQRAGPKI